MSDAVAAAGRRLEPEDQARADFYALLARLFAAPPDRALLEAIAAAPSLPPTSAGAADDGDAARLSEAWDALRAASGATAVEAIRQEYDDTFVGVGRSEINLHASHWLTGFMMEKPLAELRATLATLGLGRKPGATMVEDHLAALCETMRLLIVGDANRPPSPIADQQWFFDRHIAPWVVSCCNATSKCPIAKYYAQVAEFTKCFVAIERDSFAID